MENESTELMLQVKEKQLGKLITNAKEIKAAVIKKLEDYTPEKYTGDAKAAAKDKAELNTAAAQLNNARINLEKEWLMPFNAFKDEIKETVNLIKTASSKLDVIVKEKENEEKNAKKELIIQMWNEEHFDLVPLEKIFNSRWLNKTTKITSVKIEIKDIIERIKKDLVALESFGEDTAQLKELYLTTLNLQSALQKGAELKENRKRLKEMKAAEEKRLSETKQVVEDLQNITHEIAEQVKADNENNVSAGKNFTTVNTTTKKGEWIFNCLCNTEKQFYTLQKIADTYGLEVIPSLTLKGDTKQLQEFKADMTKSGLDYVKRSFLTLEIEGE